MAVVAWLAACRVCSVSGLRAPPPGPAGQDYDCRRSTGVWNDFEWAPCLVGRPITS